MKLDFAMVLICALSAVGFGVANLTIGSLIRPKNPSPVKATIYECGELPIGGAWFNLNPRFYVVALAFVIFEVEIVLILPVAMVFRDWVYRGRGLLALVETGVFVGILLTGLGWMWIRKDLEWMKTDGG